MNKQQTQTVFHYWLVGEQQPRVMISVSSSLLEAEKTLEQKFGDRIVKVVRLSVTSVDLAS